ncbi:hypothetical protein [Parvularcula lutaonensis]|uniref:V-SNARE coiled-coil homology domain-containing protein n=1 Tax=Parvularcula lutaonensis TaxID=491923 RepID=A0ABV7MC59_9PROT|nr:hypothetical protein [Parvularcula lutaonensis]GGY49995.1 hypothetical protein GCM10007148_18420 [Parvularcula lutaonensis]
MVDVHDRSTFSIANRNSIRLPGACHCAISDPVAGTKVLRQAEDDLKDARLKEHRGKDNIADGKKKLAKGEKLVSEGRREMEEVQQEYRSLAMAIR